MKQIEFILQYHQKKIYKVYIEVYVENVQQISAVLQKAL